MKTMKRIASILLVLMMIQALAITAFAAPTYDSITINSANVGETYAIYKLFDLSVDNENDPKAYSYTIDTDWADFFKVGGPGRQYITTEVKGEEYVTAISDAAALAKAAANWASKPTADQTKVANTESVVFDGLANGYWLVTSTLGTIAMAETTPDKANVTITEKNPENTIDKVVKEDSGNFGDENNAQIGDTVEFKTTINIVSGTRNVKVNDTMTNGLTLNANSIAITAGQGAKAIAATNYTVITTAQGFEIAFKQEWVDTLNGTNTYVITYTAILNENAVKKDANGVAIVDQNNNTEITYGNDTTVQADPTTTTTHKFTVNKYATGINDLADAVFKLTKGGSDVKLIKLDDNNYRVANGNEAGAVPTFKTVADGDIVIWGVDADGDYQLVETEAPAGYNLLKDPVDVIVEADNSLVIDVENNAGTELPSTGGMGTTIFYVFGGTLVLAAIVLLVAKKRMNNAN